MGGTHGMVKRFYFFPQPRLDLLIRQSIRIGIYQPKRVILIRRLACTASFEYELGRKWFCMTDLETNACGSDERVNVDFVR